MAETRRAVALLAVASAHLDADVRSLALVLGIVAATGSYGIRYADLAVFRERSRVTRRPSLR
jgi:hypothetical protein